MALGAEYFGIIDKYGKVWDQIAFPSKDDALRHLERYWALKGEEVPPTFSVEPVGLLVVPLSEGEG